MKYTLKKDESGQIEILQRDGIALFCPFKSSMLIPGQLQGQAILHREPCGTWCPLFTKGENSVSLLCSPADYEININLADEKKPISSNLIKL